MDDCRGCCRGSYNYFIELHSFFLPSETCLHPLTFQSSFWDFFHVWFSIVGSGAVDSNENGD